MKEEDLNKIKKNGTLVLVPYTSKDWVKSFKFMFGDCIILPTEYKENNISSFNKMVNDKLLKRLIVIDYAEAYRDIIPFISSKVEISWIMTYPIASLTDGAIRNVLRNMIE